ncbi:hypothetical protein COV49_00525 [Candidatus Falkowbacteria bacterium CG11_big_fil_rev_8_21_14_0_20_39_10]|uniref:Uncharacterized protein n=1 Tax=Candidatus Falkowbacteria bacterium CG11_big_fil_rev_8_21_14_0_20_39_10 TaxID=1974570 RepID=A0A2M6KAF7_9BACT|nr:MAG: hypothetical protein COV49_00525 [Candidatus Falkowbacteria bacterium CG11_big_fil_rev_8_21_14_0_20_39_10]
MEQPFNKLEAVPIKKKPEGEKEEEIKPVKASGINKNFTNSSLTSEAQTASIIQELDKDIKIDKALETYPVVNEVIEELKIDVKANPEIVMKLIDFVKKRKGVNLNDERESQMLKETLTKKANQELSEAA